MSEEPVAYQAAPGLELSGGYAEYLRPFLMAQRQALLMQVDSIERMLGIEPTTAELRKRAKCARVCDEGGG